MLVKHLFTLLHKETSRSNVTVAIICGPTTFVAGIIPTLTYLLLPKSFNSVMSWVIVAAVVGVSLVRCRLRRAKVHWKVTLFQTVAIVIIATVASLIVGSIT
jgi:uncharacterized membrane protein YfcA